MASDYTCFKCNSPLPIETPQRVGFRESCPKCTTDIHCCKNCNFYDQKVYNECKETSAERIVDKEKGNRCEYFVARSSKVAGGTAVDSTRKKLDDLFK